MTKGLVKDGVYGKGKEDQEVRGWEKSEFSVQTWLSHFTNEKREAQGEETQPGSHGMTELGLSQAFAPTTQACTGPFPSLDIVSAGIVAGP